MKTADLGIGAMQDRRRTRRLWLGAISLALIGMAASAAGAAPAAFTEEQAARGKGVFDTSCAMCHGAALTGGPGGPPLTGPSFRGRWDVQSAAALLTYMREKMPPGGPLKGGDATYADLLAHILKANGGLAGGVALSSDVEVLASLNIATALPPAPKQANAVRSVVANDLRPDAIAQAAEQARVGLLQALRPVTDQMLRDPPRGSWLHWRRTYDAQGFGDLTQIGRGNVRSLQVAWAWQMAPSTNQVAPLVHDGVLFATSAGRLQALNAATGDLLWEYVRAGRVYPVRSLSIYGDLIYLAAGTSVVALDIHTGKVVWDHLVASIDSTLRLNAGPIAAKGKVFQGVSGCINPYPGGCFIVALDAKTGHELWRFNTIARPGQPGGDTWNDAPLDERFGGSIWMSGSYDPDLDLLYFGPGQTYRTATLINGKTIADRAAGLYTDSTVALRPETGELAWYYQHMPGDVWDLDWSYERTLATLDVNGAPRRTVTTAGKLGIFDTLDARTGEYIRSTDVGFQNMVTAIDPKTGAKTLNPAVMPQAGAEQYICPSAIGVRNWPSTSYNPRTGVLFVPLNETCMNWIWQPGGNYDMGLRRLPGNTDGFLGRTQAIDLKTGRTLWTVRERAPRVAALLATAGGLVFQGTKDRWFKALDDRTGKVLWQVRLDGPPASFPITYDVAGEQYVALTTGGGTPLEQAVLTQDIVSPSSSGATTLWVFKLPKAGSRR